MRHVTSSLLVAMLGIGVLGWVAPVRSQDRPPDPGKIRLFDGSRLASVQPDGRKQVQFPRELASLGYFQPHTARVAPDGRGVAYGLGEF